ncbi:MAG: hypothetical protein JSW25_10405 [Thermoplasmata archaeon]|nr:MAG: hypothetical protein JSW25_10405 [Thermoplasmata archaeon]
MASDRPEVAIRPGFSAAQVAFEVNVTNPGSHSLWSLVLKPRPIPPTTPIDRDSHSIPLLRPKRSRKVVFRLRPELGQRVVALDLTIEWEDDAGDTRGRSHVSSKPVELVPPSMSAPRGNIERWRAGLSGGAAVDARIRQPVTPPEMLDALEERLSGTPGHLDVQREEGPRGPMGRVWVRAEGSRGKRAGLLVDVTPDPKLGGCRVLVTVTATSEELLAQFYASVLPDLAAVVPGIEELTPHSLSQSE